MNLFELQQWIEQDQVLLFHLKHKAKGTIRHLEKGKKCHVNPEKLLLVETGILASCYQERDLIYALTPPRDYLRMSQPDTYVEALERTNYWEYDLNEVEAIFKSDALFTHLLLSLLQKEKRILERQLFYATHNVEEKMRYTLSSFLQLAVKLSYPQKSRQTDILFPKWFHLKLLARLVNATTVSVSRALPSVAQQMNLETKTKPWRWRKPKEK
ncbi:hypothetical protein [Listeria valentina]|uniref:hypothetical protein n=1 Tax=Listeria valentina TaxID=2705293 RepID=UPI00143116DA|nr:hypothetical protein [Listeria valentina]